MSKTFSILAAFSMADMETLNADFARGKDKSKRKSRLVKASAVAAGVAGVGALALGGRRALNSQAGQMFKDRVGSKVSSVLGARSQAGQMLRDRVGANVAKVGRGVAGTRSALSGGARDAGSYLMANKKSVGGKAAAGLGAAAAGVGGYNVYNANQKEKKSAKGKAKSAYKSLRQRLGQ